MITRRGFFTRLLGATVAAKLAPFLPKPLFTPRYYDVAVPISMEEINAVTMANIMPGVADEFFKASPLLAYLKDKGIKPHGGPKYAPIVYPPGCLPAEIIGGGDDYDDFEDEC